MLLATNTLASLSSGIIVPFPNTFGIDLFSRSASPAPSPPLLPRAQILASASLPMQEWEQRCEGMTTNHVVKGSMFLTAGSRAAEAIGAAAAGTATQERFLVKWQGLSHLHVSWETERDLAQYEGKTTVAGKIKRFRAATTAGKTWHSQHGKLALPPVEKRTRCVACAHCGGHPT